MINKAAIILLTVCIMTGSIGITGTAAALGDNINEKYGVERFADVPAGHWADDAIHFLKSINVAQGIGQNKFGMGQPVKRDEFITYLVKLMGWKPVAPDQGSYTDVSKKHWAYTYIETAAANGIIDGKGGKLEPDGYITREEIAVMLVKAMGFDSLAGQLENVENQFTDVKHNSAYINMVKDFGIIGGKGNGLFGPEDPAKKEEAAVMLYKMYLRLNERIRELHGFYAIKSYDQLGYMKDMDTVGYGWSTLSYDPVSKQVRMDTSSSGGSDYYIPQGYVEPLMAANLSGKTALLSLYASNDTKLPNEQGQPAVGLVEQLLSNTEEQQRLLQDIAGYLTGAKPGYEQASFAGIVIDFENLRGENNKNALNNFLALLRTELDRYGKKLYVAVQPKVGGDKPYFDGYDYRFIGDIADRVILMAHDYNATRLTEQEMAIGYTDTPLTPYDEIYYALKAITDGESGVRDPGKVLLQLSFASAQWKLSEGKVLNAVPYHPAYTQIAERIAGSGSENKLAVQYSEKLQNPWITYYNDSDKTDNIIWYEDSRSILAKIKLARMFGINGISVWRLGTIPDFPETGVEKAYLDIWPAIVGEMGKK